MLGNRRVRLMKDVCLMEVWLKENSRLVSCYKRNGAYILQHSDEECNFVLVKSTLEDLDETDMLRNRRKPIDVSNGRPSWKSKTTQGKASTISSGR